MSQSSNVKPLSLEVEAAMIRRDFIKSIIINSIFLIALIALFYANRSAGILDKFIARFS